MSDSNGAVHGPATRVGDEGDVTSGGARRAAPIIPRLSAAAEERIQEIMRRYPSTKSAVMPALYIAQEELGFVNDLAVAWVADRLSLAPSHVVEVASFYTMYYKKPVGRYHVQVCRTLSCMLCGAKQITAHLRARLKLEPRQVSADGTWSYEEVECLGSCGTAPMVQINDVFFENLTAEKLDQLMDRIEREKPDLRYSTVHALLGDGMNDCPRSVVHLSVDKSPAGK